MSGRKQGHSSSKRRLIGVALFVMAVLFGVLSWQSVSTEKYALYSQNLVHYMNEMEECESLVDGVFGTNYQYLASQWRELADEARGYLTQHRAGAFSLLACATLCVAGGAYLIASTFKRKDEDE